MQELNTGIYSITNVADGTVYIGQAGSARGFGGRWCIHKRFLRRDIYSKQINVHLWRAFKKYGEESFRFDVVVRCPPIGKLLDAYEIYFIAEAKKNGAVYNHTIGGNSGRLGLSHSPETRAKLSAKNKGRKWSVEARLKMSRDRKGKTRPGNSSNFKHSEKAKQRMSIVHSKTVRCIETGVVFSSVREAAEKMDLHSTTICQQIKGRVKHTGGFHFEYVKESKETFIYKAKE